MPSFRSTGQPSPSAEAQERIISLPADLRECVSPLEWHWLTSVFSRFDGQYPSLQQMWALMDEVWDELGCDPAVMDERIAEFYSHPVWLLNGLFVEQHAESLAHRERFTRWAAAQGPTRIADYGGGYGTLARMIARACPTASVEVIEPHPHRLALELASRTHNVRYRSELSGQYDVLIATDVFEHVPDPLALVAETANQLAVGGRYLIANCFFPVIDCHLPQTFHLRYSWDSALIAMGMVPREAVAYGRVFERAESLEIGAARRIERRSKQLFPWLRRLPGRIARPLAKVLLRVGE